MPWHSFKIGREYSRNEVIAICNRQIERGGIVDVEGKREALERLRRHAPTMIVWSPVSSGWGASPFNPRCWRTPDNEPAV